MAWKMTPWMLKYIWPDKVHPTLNCLHRFVVEFTWYRCQERTIFRFLFLSQPSWKHDYYSCVRFKQLKVGVTRCYSSFNRKIAFAVVSLDTLCCLHDLPGNSLCRCTEHPLPGFKDVFFLPLTSWTYYILFYFCGRPERHLSLNWSKQKTGCMKRAMTNLKKSTRRNLTHWR